MKALTLLEDGGGGGGTLVVEGSHKVAVPTTDLLALAQGGAGLGGTSALVRNVLMGVGDTMFFFESLLHAAPPQEGGGERIAIMGAWKPDGMALHPNLGGPGFATASSPALLAALPPAQRAEVLKTEAAQQRELREVTAGPGWVGGSAPPPPSSTYYRGGLLTTEDWAK